MLLHEAANRVPRKPTLVEPWQGKRPVVLHTLADEHTNVGSDGCRGVPDTHGVIEQELVFPNEKQEWGQSRKLGENRREIRRAAVRTTDVVTRPFLKVLAGEPKVLATIVIHGRARHRQIRPRREQERAVRHGQAEISKPHEQTETQAPSRRVAGEENRRVLTESLHKPPSNERIVESCRI